MSEEVRKENSLIILFGATGDLATRKLYPALYNILTKENEIDNFAVIGIGRRELDHDGLRGTVDESLNSHINDYETDASFLERFHYYQLDVTDDAGYDGLKDLSEHLDRQYDLQGNKIFYLSLAPEFFGTVAGHLQTAGLTDTAGYKRLVIEKPFGRDLETAQILNGELTQIFSEDEIYRIDHYLGKEMVQNIQAIRFSNPIFESIWNNKYISNVQITSSETLGVGERASYYDQAGALLDMVQNHILQMVALTAMEPPTRFETEDIRDEKVKVLRAIRPITSEIVGTSAVRGQYTRGAMANGAVVKGYREEDGVQKETNTDTFVAAKIQIDNFRWAGVPFYIRTGKRMSVKSTEIAIQFKDTPLNPYFKNGEEVQPNILVIHVQPDEGISLKLNMKKFGSTDDTMPVTMEFSNSGVGENGSIDAYERLIHDCFRGDSTNFTRWDEVALSWKFVDGIAKAWEDKSIPVDTYPAGTMGPVSSDELLARDGVKWWRMTKIDQ